MRKLITSSVFILLFTLFSGSVFAGKYDYECGEFKKQKQLYGLCNAYQNALAHDDVDAMADIERNWDKRVDENGEPELPGRIDGNQSCPCWTEEQMRQAACYLAKGDGKIYPFGSYVEFDTNQVLFQAGVAINVDSPTSCTYRDSYTSPVINDEFPTTSEQDELCRAAVDLLINDGLSDMCGSS